MSVSFVEVVWEGPGPAPVDANRLQALLQDVLADEGARGEVTVVLTNDEELHRLNQAFRDVDAPTDVLSFDLRDDGGPDPVLGEVYISMERAGRQAADGAHPLSDEVDLLAVHGMLHLLGFDHDTDEAHEQMRRRERHHLGEGATHRPTKGA
jgi:probable rRNA maturation factor